MSRSSKYPDVTDEDFYPSIVRNFKKYKIPKQQKSLKQLCFPKTYEHQLPQTFLGEFINPKTPYKGVLVYHRIGAGKTCGGILICEKFKNVANVVVVLPASLKGNFRSELRSLCTGDSYMSNKDRKALKDLSPDDPEYRAIIERSDQKIDKFYTIYSYNKFIALLQTKSLKLDNTLLLIDEVHNMISETGIYYELLHKAIRRAPDSLRLVIMTATPIFDKPTEIALTMNLLLRDKQMPIGSKFVDKFIDIQYTKKGVVYSLKNMELFKSYIKGYVSYFSGAPAHTFPRSELHLTRCKMSDEQVKLYRRVNVTEKDTEMADYVNANIPNSFFIGTRMISNFMFSNKKIGKAGFKSLKETDLTTEGLKICSPKFLKILRRIKRCDGTVFVYSNFKEYGGIKTFVRMLEQHDFKNFETNGVGKKRFGIWSGDQSFQYKEDLKAVFNNKNNEDGSQIKIILASPSAKEGVSFFRMQEVHILEPYWNWSRIEQIIGRAIRYCSHKDVPYEKQLVKVYIYLAVHPKIKRTVDEKIINMAIGKKEVNLAFERAIKEAAIDCQLFINANSRGERLVCDT